MYPPALCCAKFSVLLLYRRLFPQPGFHQILWGVGGFVLVYTVVQEFTMLFQCNPMAGAWDPAVYARATCIRLNLEWVIMASFNVLTDIVTLFLPLPLVWRLQIDRERKFQLLGVFLLGGL